jgi:hypothetical protein
MMFVLRRKHAYGPPRSVTAIALFYFILCYWGAVEKQEYVHDFLVVCTEGPNGRLSGREMYPKCPKVYSLLLLFLLSMKFAHDDGRIIRKL